MAFTSTGFWLNLEFRDLGKGKTSRRHQMATQIDYVAQLTLAAAVKNAYEAISDAEIVAYSVAERFVEAAIVLPPAGTQIENLAVISGKIFEHPEKSATLTVPAPKDAIFVGASGDNYDIVDLDDAAVATYLDFFRNGTAATPQLYVSDGEELEDSTFGYKGRRGHAASSKS